MKSYGNNTHSVEKFHIFFKKIYKKQHNMVTGIISFTIFHSFVLLTSYICIYCVPKLDFSVLFLLFFFRTSLCLKKTVMVLHGLQEWNTIVEAETQYVTFFFCRLQTIHIPLNY